MAGKIEGLIEVIFCLSGEGKKLLAGRNTILYGHWTSIKHGPDDFGYFLSGNRLGHKLLNADTLRFLEAHVLRKAGAEDHGNVGPDG